MMCVIFIYILSAISFNYHRCFFDLQTPIRQRSRPAVPEETETSRGAIRNVGKDRRQPRNDSQCRNRPTSAEERSTMPKETETSRGASYLYKCCVDLGDLRTALRVCNFLTVALTAGCFLVSCRCNPHLYGKTKTKRKTRQLVTFLFMFD